MEQQGDKANQSGEVAASSASNPEAVSSDAIATRRVLRARNKTTTAVSGTTPQKEREKEKETPENTSTITTDARPNNQCAE